MSRPALTKTETNKSTDEDYESDESDIDRITTRLCDPKEDGDTLEELASESLSPLIPCTEARLLSLLLRRSLAS